VHVVALGPDGRYGTADDKHRRFSTSAFGATDPEAIAMGRGSLWIGAGADRRVFRVRPGPNGRMEGANSDDVITSFSVEPLVGDLEGLEYRPGGTLLLLDRSAKADILEVTLRGAMVDTVDLSGVPLESPSEITYGPASRDPTRRSYYIADRGVDNKTDPDENDGRIFEVAAT
jgi:hypothetical protein